MLDSFEAVFYTLAFVVPGFIMLSSFRMIVKTRDETSQINLIRFVCFSSINYGVWSWLIYLLVKTNFLSHSLFLRSLLWLFIIFISPILLGLFIGYLSDRNIVSKLLTKLGLKIIQPIPSAWDYFFSKILQPIWVLVTLQDGSEIAGIFGIRSFSSSDNQERDLYLEKVYSICTDGSWCEVVDSKGVLISSRHIKSLEFWQDGKKEQVSRSKKVLMDTKQVKKIQLERLADWERRGYQAKIASDLKNPPKGGTNIKRPNP